MAFFSQKQTGQAEVSGLPRHVAVIMDGNGRWAQRRGLPRTAGHKAGAETFRTIATYCKDLGMDYLTVYAFSTENWKRPQGEVDAIMSLLDQYLHESIETMARDNIRLRFLGDVSVLSPRLRALIEETDEITRGYIDIDTEEIAKHIQKKATRSCAPRGALHANVWTERRRPRSCRKRIFRATSGRRDCPTRSC